MRVEMQDYHIHMDQQDPLSSQRNAFYIPECYCRSAATDSSYLMPIRTPLRRLR